MFTKHEINIFAQSQIIAHNMVTLVAGLQLEQLLARSDGTGSNAISKLHHQNRVNQAPREGTGPLPGELTHDIIPNVGSS